MAAALRPSVCYDAASRECVPAEVRMQTESDPPPGSDLFLWLVYLASHLHAVVRDQSALYGEHGF